MIESVLLDLLLVLIVLLLAAVGTWRGGLREAFSAAGVVLGALLAIEWSPVWGGWLSDNTSLSPGGAAFAVSVLILVVTVGAVGYGVGASFNYHPGPGGRMFGAALGAAGALVGMAYVLSWMREQLYAGDEAEVIANTWLARWLDGNVGWLLLVLSLGLVFGASFGAIVRERDDDVVEASAAASPRPSRAPEKIEPAAPRQHPTTPVRVQQGRQWEDRADQIPPADRQWSNTWPSDAPGIPQEERTPRQSEVQQARERRRSQREEGGGDRR